MMKAEELPIHDYAVNLCIKRNDLLSTSAYLKSKVVFIDTASDDGVFADCIYPQTIYGCAETGVMRDDVTCCTIIISFLICFCWHNKSSYITLIKS